MLDSPIYHLKGVVKAKAEDLEDFQGPLDLILHLLSKNQMEIKDIQLSLILQQYLQWMEHRKELDLEVASEFVTMASHLVDIKARMLLSIQDAETVNEIEELIATLEAHRNNETYRLVKEVTPQLRIKYAHGQNYGVKPPETLEQCEELLFNHTAKDLWKAMQQIYRREERTPPLTVGAFQGIVGREPYPVAEKAEEILAFLLERGDSGVAVLIAHCQSRSEVVATFIALLDLCKNDKLHITITDNAEYMVSYIEER